MFSLVATGRFSMSSYDSVCCSCGSDVDTLFCRQSFWLWM